MNLRGGAGLLARWVFRLSLTVRSLLPPCRLQAFGSSKGKIASIIVINLDSAEEVEETPLADLRDSSRIVGGLAYYITDVDEYEDSSSLRMRDTASILFSSEAIDAATAGFLGSNTTVTPTAYVPY